MVISARILIKESTNVSSGTSGNKSRTANTNTANLPDALAAVEMCREALLRTLGMI